MTGITMMEITPMTNVSLPEPPKETAQERARHQARAAKIVRDQNRIHIQQLAGKLLDAFDRVLNAVQAPPDNKPSRATVRRQTANLLGLPKLCANNTCRRAHCCRGQPLDCLRTVVFLLPPEMIENLALTRRRKRARGQSIFRSSPRKRGPRARHSGFPLSRE
jgi:hypothetical protein